MDKIDPNTITPLYKQLYNILAKAIEDKTLRPGNKISSEEKLQKQFGISRVTVRRALQCLVDEEKLLKIHGKGTFVAEGRFSENGVTSGSFTDACLQMNATPTTRIITQTLQPAKRRIAEKLGIKPGEDIIYIQRLRLVNGVSYILEKDYCPRNLRFLLDIDLENQSIFSLIRKNLGVIPACFEDHFAVGYASKADAVLLGCEPGTALLQVNRFIGTKNINILYYSEQFIRSDRYKYAVRYV
jgi:GntR family transcriptional regulator